jgi:hypothetical protein
VADDEVSISSNVYCRSHLYSGASSEPSEAGSRADAAEQVPPLHAYGTVAAWRRHLRLQPAPPAIATYATCGCSLRHLRLQDLRGFEESGAGAAAEAAADAGADAGSDAHAKADAGPGAGVDCESAVGSDETDSDGARLGHMLADVTVCVYLLTMAILSSTMAIPTRRVWRRKTWRRVR